ncbi:MAG: DUF3570 domain-containing protein [Halioglobus sp.]
MSDRKVEQNATLLALTSSALLLPGYQHAAADAPPDYTELGIRYSQYEEDDTKSSKTFGGASERYEIGIAQFHLLAPVSDDWSLALDVQYEDMSGASPWFVGESLGGDPKVIMSGASIEDSRTDVSVTTRYYYDRGNAGFNYTRSEENDYESDAIGLDASFNDSDGLTTYSAAISLSKDDIEPTQGSIQPTNTLKDEKDIRSGWIGVTRIVSKRAILRFGLGYTYREGFLTDPYKLNDRRPDERSEWAISTGYRHFFVESNAAIHVDYRYFDDDWGVSSHTVDLAWHQNIGQSSQLVPFLRYYTQDNADFFANLEDIEARYYADDYRLSAYGAFSAGLRFNYSFGDWRVNLTGERYRTSSDWGVFGGEESPALVDFWRYGIGLDYAFK